MWVPPSVLDFFYLNADIISIPTVVFLCVKTGLSSWIGESGSVVGGPGTIALDKA